MQAQRQTVTDTAMARLKSARERKARRDTTRRTSRTEAITASSVPRSRGAASTSEA